MKDENKSKEQLIGELAEMRQELDATSERLRLAEAVEGEREQVEESLRFTQFAINHVADAALWMGSDARLVYVNDAACQSLGYSREELLAMTMHDISPDFPVDVWVYHWEEVKERRAFTIETCCRTRDGQLTPVELTVNFVEFKGQEYNCAFVRDVGKRKRLEEALYGERAWLETLFELSRRLNVARDEDELLMALTQSAIEAGAVQADLMYVDLNNAGEPEWAQVTAVWRAAALDSTPAPIGTRYYLPDYPLICQWISQANMPLLVSDASKDERMDENTRNLLSQMGSKALASIPLTQAQRVMGLVNFGWANAHEFSEQEVEIYRILINLASPTVQNRRLMGNLEHIVAERTSQLSTASDIAGQIGAMLDPDELLNTVIVLLKERFDLYYAHVHLLDEDTQELRLRAGYGEPGRIMLEQGWKTSLDDESSLIAEAARYKDIVIVSDVARSRNYVPNPLLPDVRSELAVPLIVPSPTGGRLLGVFAAQHDTARYFTPAHLDVFSALAGQVATALQNAALFEEIQMRFDVSQALVGVETEEEVLDVLIRLADIYPHTGVAIYLLDRETRYLAMTVDRNAVFDSGLELIAEGRFISHTEYPLIHLIAPDESFASSNVFADERVNQGSQAIAREIGFTSIAMFPITAGTKWMGVFVAMCKEEGGIDNRQRLFYHTLADQGATALQAGRLSVQVQESEERFRRLSDATVEGIVIHDQGIILDANQTLATMFGYESPDELIGTSVLESRVTPETRDSIREKTLAGYEGAYEGVGIRQDGSTFPFEQEVSFASYRGREVGVVAIRDITERKQAAEALQESEGKLRSLVEQSVDGITLVDEQGSVIEWNQGQEKITGWKQSEVLGQPFWDVQFQMFPTARHAPSVYEQVKNSFTRFLETGQAPWLYRLREQEIQRPDGTRRTIQQVSFPITTDKGFMAGHFTRDITVQVQATEALRRRNHELAMLSRVSRELTATLDLEQVTGRLLQEIREAIGAEGTSVWLWDEEDEQEAEEKREGWLVCQNALHPVLDRPVIGLRLRPGQGIASLVAQTQESVIIPYAPDDPFFSHNIDAQTNFRTRSLLAVPLRASGRVVGVLEVVNKLEGNFSRNDLSLVETLAASAAIAIDNARLVETLQGRTDELQSRNQELDAYAHTVAHDLKGPLGHMVGFAQVLEQDYAELSAAELLRCSRTIAQGGRKMSNIIDELLLMAGLRDAEVVLEPLDMAFIVRESHGRLGFMVEQYQAEILIPAPEDWPVALGQAGWLEEVWVNYLSNALKYGGQPPHVELGFDVNPPIPPRLDQGGKENMIGFWVRDNGHGLTPDEQARLFTPFTRIEQTRAKGHGLGLSIVQRIVAKLGGQVWMESKMGVGSIFWFTLLAQT